MRLSIYVSANSGTPIWDDYFTGYEGAIPSVGHIISYLDSLNTRQKAVVKNIEWVISFDGVEEVKVLCAEQ